MFTATAWTFHTQCLWDLHPHFKSLNSKLKYSPDNPTHRWIPMLTAISSAKIEVVREHHAVTFQRMPTRYRCH